MKLHILGTGHATVVDNYNTCFCIENNGKFALVDAGGGNRILKQLKLAGIDSNDIECAFLTHRHTDHILGFVWLCRFLMKAFLEGKRKNKFTIFGQQEDLSLLKTILYGMVGDKWCDACLEKYIFLKPVADGARIKLADLKVNVFDTYATDMPQIAFYIKEKDFVFAGDVPLNEKYFKRFKNSKWLCLEGFCCESERMGNEMPLKKHKTIAEASQVAEQLHVENLILWHTADDLGKKREKVYMKEAKENCSANVIVPKDLQVIEIK